MATEREKAVRFGMFIFCGLLLSLLLMAAILTDVVFKVRYLEERVKQLERK